MATIIIEETTVVKIQRSKGVIVQDCDIYIGRAINRGGWGLPASKWRNQFDYLVKYINHLYDSDLVNDILELDGKRLGCWCKPARCHGDILKYVVDNPGITKEAVIAYFSN